MFGENDILKGQMATETYTAMCDCYLLCLHKNVFFGLMEEFEDFKQQVLDIAKAREKIRIKQRLQKEGVLPEAPKTEKIM